MSDPRLISSNLAVVYLNSGSTTASVSNSCILIFSILSSVSLRSSPARSARRTAPSRSVAGYRSPRRPAVRDAAKPRVGEGWEGEDEEGLACTCVFARGCEYIERDNLAICEGGGAGRGRIMRDADGKAGKDGKTRCGWKESASGLSFH